MAILLLGGDSRLARRIAARRPFARSVVRHGTADAVTTVVADYAEVPLSAFVGIATVVNCVGTPVGSPATLHAVNHDVAFASATRARAAGCRHFIQVSSLSVYGRAEQIDGMTPVAPVSAYGRSKAAADAALSALDDDAFAVTILRVPALYGRGAAGKFGALARAMRRLGGFPVSRPLPQRSLLHLDNAAAVIAALPPQNGVVLAADHDLFDLGVLADVLARLDVRRPVLVPLPRFALAPLAIAAPAVYAGLFAASVIDAAAAISTSMTLPVGLRDGLAEMLAA